MDLHLNYVTSEIRAQIYQSIHHVNSSEITYTSNSKGKVFHEACNVIVYLYKNRATPLDKHHGST